VKILIVKLSSLGDIFHAYSVPTFLKQAFPGCHITWACDERFKGALSAHPHVDRVLGLTIAEFKKSLGRKSAFKKMVGGISIFRKERFDYVLDLQSNCKSGLLVGASRGEEKIGFTFKTAREWPASLFVNRRVERKPGLHKSDELLDMVARAFKQPLKKPKQQVVCQLKDSEKSVIKAFKKEYEKLGRIRVMVAMGSAWKNKQLSTDLWVEVLSFLSAQYPVDFFCVWGNCDEERQVEKVAHLTSGSVTKLPKMSIALWQAHMNRMHGLLGLDSSALHLAATLHLPTFAFFGPTLSKRFNPSGKQHQFYKGSCPYSAPIEDDEKCSYYKVCLTGACLKQLLLSSFKERLNSWFSEHVLTKKFSAFPL
jgi:heptosyltransferase I